MMTSQLESPGAAGTATEGKNETGQVQTQEYLIRKEWAIAAWFALGPVDIEDFQII